MGEQEVIRKLTPLFTSRNTKRLDVEGTVAKILATDFVKGWSDEKTEVSNNVIAQDIMLDPKVDWSY